MGSNVFTQTTRSDVFANHPYLQPIAFDSEETEEKEEK